LTAGRSNSYTPIDVQGIDVLHFIAAWTLALLFIRGAQALSEHYFPGSGANTTARFLYGGPS
jgi:hypothetical protein